MARQDATALHHHSIVEETHKHKRDGELHDSIESLEEEDRVESDRELQQEGTDLEEVSHHNRNQQRTKRLEQVSHQTQTNVLVVGDAAEQRDLKDRALFGRQQQGRLIQLVRHRRLSDG